MHVEQYRTTTLGDQGLRDICETLAKSLLETFSYVQGFETEDGQLVAEPDVRRNHGKTMRKSRGHYSGPTVWIRTHLQDFRHWNTVRTDTEQWKRDTSTSSLH